MSQNGPKHGSSDGIGQSYNQEVPGSNLAVSRSNETCFNIYGVLICKYKADNNEHARHV